MRTISDSNYLQDLIISLTSWNTTDLSVARICYLFSNNSLVPAGTTLTFKCTIQPTWGRFLMVRRMENASFRPDALAIAEFKVYEQTPTSIPLPVTGDWTLVGNFWNLNINNQFKFMLKLIIFTSIIAWCNFLLAFYNDLLLFAICLYFSDEFMCWKAIIFQWI